MKPSDSRERVLVLGLGNPLRGDDGIGEWVAQRLEEEPWEESVAIRHIIQLTPEWAEMISQAERVYIVDASVEIEPGAWKRERVQDISSDCVCSSHHFTPALLLSMAYELYETSPWVYLVTIGVWNLDSGKKLSEGVRRAGEEVVAFLKKEIHDSSASGYTS